MTTTQNTGQKAGQGERGQTRPGPGADTQEHDDILPGGNQPGEQRLHAVRRRLEGLLGIPATEGNEVTVLRNGDEIFPSMLQAIRDAERTIDLLTYIYWTGPIAEEMAHALAERARAGLRVRVLIDAIGGRLLESDLVEHMEDCGVHVSWFRAPWRVSPFKQNHRTHRKVLVVDERVAFTGGVGIAEEWMGDARDPSEWRDTHVRFVGPAVDGVRAAFAQNWAGSGHALSDGDDRFPEHERPGDSIVTVVRGSASLGWNDIETVFHVLVDGARERVRIATAYFMPDDELREALVRAARRGVDVQVLVPGPYTDKRVSVVAGRDVYEELIEGGVVVSEFQPTMLHAKILTVDGLVSVVGSANLNRRSHHHDDEVVAVVMDQEVTAVLDEHYVEDLGRSEAIDLDRWEDRPLPWRVVEKATGALRHWL